MLLTVLSYLLNAYSHSNAFKYCHLAMKKKNCTRTSCTPLPGVGVQLHWLRASCTCWCQQWLWPPVTLLSQKSKGAGYRTCCILYFCKGFSTICMQCVKCSKIVAYWKVDNVLLLTYFFKAIFSHQLILLLALCLRSLSSSPPLYCALELNSVAKQSSPEANCTD